MQSIGEDRDSYTVAGVAQPDQTQADVDPVVEHWGGTDVVLANAGIEGAMFSIPDYPIEVFDRVMAVNARGVGLGIKCAVPVMREWGVGRIVITSSTAGIGGTPDMSAYNTSKHAVIGLMRTSTLEGAPFGIRINTVNPSPVGPARLPAQRRIGVGPRPFPNKPLRVLTNLPHHLRRRADISYLSGALTHIDRGNFRVLKGAGGGHV